MSKVTFLAPLFKDECYLFFPEEKSPRSSGTSNEAIYYNFWGTRRQIYLLEDEHTYIGESRNKSSSADLNRMSSVREFLCACPGLPPILYRGPPERVLLDLCSELRVLNRSQLGLPPILRMTTSDTTS